MTDIPALPSTRFKAGNPGRRKGSRNKRTEFWASIEETMQEAAPDIVSKLLEKAKAGDPKAMELYLARVVVVPRCRRLPIRLPNITDSRGLAAAFAATAKGLSDGIITPDEAVQVAALLEGQRKNLEGSDTIQRLKVIEAELEARGIGGSHGA